MQRSTAAAAPTAAVAPLLAEPAAFWPFSRGLWTRGLPLAARITLVLLAVAAMTAAGLAWFGQQIVLKTFAETEMTLVRQNRTILNRAIASELEHLRAITTDWGQWDEFYEYVEGRNPKFRTGALGVVLDRLKLDVILLIDPAGHLSYGDTRPSDSNGPAGVDSNAADELAAQLSGAPVPGKGVLSGRASLLPEAGSRATIAGLMDTARGPMVVAMRAISPTNGTGAAVGTLVMGRYLHADRLITELSVLPSTVITHYRGPDELSEEIHALVLDLVQTADGSRLVTRQDDMSDFKLFRNLAGTPAFMLETRMPRSIVAIGRNTAQLLLMGLLVTVAILILILVTLIRGMVSVPLGLMTEHILALRDSSELLPTPGRNRSDEIGALARRFEELMAARHADQARLEQLAAAVEHADDAIVILDADSRIRYVNPQYERQTGLSQAEVLGKDPSRGEVAGADEVELWARVKSGLSWSGILQSTARNGSIRYEEGTVAPIKAGSDHIAGYVAVMRDITARREADAELRNLSTVVEFTAECIVVLDATGRIQYVNPAYERKRGVRSADVVGKTPREVRKSRDDPALYDDMWRTVTARHTWNGRITTELNNERVITENVVVSPVVTDGAPPSSYVILLHDITEQIQLEEQLTQAQKLEAVGQLAAGVAHEINTPTQYVGGNIRFLGDAFTSVSALLDEIARLARSAGDGSVPVNELARALTVADVEFLQAEVPVAIRQSLEGVERVGEIVRSMRELTHPVRDFTPTDLNRVVESAVRVAGRELLGIASVSTELDPNLPQVPCLAGSINQVIVNILVNAVHAIEAGIAQRRRQPGRIVVVTCQAGDTVEIHISDNGSGMTEEVRARVFDPFFTTKQAGSGTGQGLAIAHSVVKKHKGSITVESELGRGTCFTIRLPLA